VMYTVIESLTRDGRDRSLDYKITGFHVPKGSWDAQVLKAIAPAGDEIVLPKTSSSVFISTNIDYVLRNLGVRQLVIAGLVTDQCIESAVRDACDLGYLVTLVTDACAAYSQERHDHALHAIKGYCRQRTTDELLAELSGAREPGASAAS
jgi:ureidoacrylate peracid hydrolase